MFYAVSINNLIIHISRISVRANCTRRLQVRRYSSLVAQGGGQTAQFWGSGEAIITPCVEYLQTFTHIYPKNHPNVGKYTSTMEHMGFWCVIWCSRWMPEGSFCIASSRERIAIMSGTQPFRGIHPDQWEISRIQLMEVRYYHIRPYELWGYSLKIRPKK